MSLPFAPQPKPQHKRKAAKRGYKTTFRTNTRKTIIERDEGLCVRCNAPYEEIHHVVFRSAGGLGTVDNGVCVCHTCHEQAHRYRVVRKWFERYREKNLL